MKKKNMALIIVIVFLLTVSIGYALFSETLTITGTATAAGSFDVKFVDPGVEPKTVGYEKTGLEKISVISEDGNKLIITVNKLLYPGAYVEIPVKVLNEGSIAVVLEPLDESTFKVDAPMKVTHTEIAGTELQSKGTVEFKVKVEWEPTAVDTPSQNVTSTFELKLNYKQKQG